MVDILKLRKISKKRKQTDPVKKAKSESTEPEVVEVEVKPTVENEPSAPSKQESGDDILEQESEAAKVIQEPEDGIISELEPVPNSELFDEINDDPELSVGASSAQSESVIDEKPHVKKKSVKELLAEKKLEKAQEQTEKINAEIVSELEPEPIIKQSSDQPKIETSEPPKTPKRLIKELLAEKKLEKTEKLTAEAEAVAEADRLFEIETTETTSKEDEAKDKKSGNDIVESAETESDGQAEKRGYVTFSLDGHIYGINIKKVQEVVKYPEVTRVPQVVDYIIGVINLRGIITPVIDLHKRLKFGSIKITAKTKIVILQLGADHKRQTIGFTVDKISEILHIAKDLINKTPEMALSIETKYIKGIARIDQKNGEEKLVILLDPDKIYDKNTGKIVQSMKGEV